MGQVPDIAVITSLMQLIQLAADPSSLDPNLQVSTSSALDCSSVQFYLATRNDANGNVEACLEQTNTIFNGTFDASKPTKLLVHGWKNSRRTEFTTNLTISYLNRSDVNVIQVDWSAIAEKDYVTARYKVPDVAKTVAAFIQRITQELQVEYSDLHLVGHSLGAHVVGIAGYQFQSPNKIRTITGLDPAWPLFWFTGSDGMITKESAEFVVILHTCAGLLGTPKQVGHIDFYPNGGIPIQPGCGIDILGFCSHDRAVSFYSESLEDSTAFKGTRCSSYELYLNGLCKSNDHTFLGEEVNRNTFPTLRSDDEKMCTDNKLAVYIDKIHLFYGLSKILLSMSSIITFTNDEYTQRMCTMMGWLFEVGKFRGGAAVGANPSDQSAGYLPPTRNEFSKTFPSRPMTMMRLWKEKGRNGRRRIL